MAGWTKESTLKGWETRRKNGTDHKCGGITSEGALKGWETRRKNGINIKETFLKGWKTRKNGIESNREKFQNWKNQVWLNHNGVCAKVGCDKNKLNSKKKEIICHHILSREERPDLLYDVGNGCLLCRGHHMDYHKKYSENGSRETLAEYLWNMKS